MALHAHKGSVTVLVLLQTGRNSQQNMLRAEYAAIEGELIRLKLIGTVPNIEQSVGTSSSKEGISRVFMAARHAGEKEGKMSLGDNQ